MEFKFNITILGIFKEDQLFSIKFIKDKKIYNIDDNKYSVIDYTYSIFDRGTSFYKPLDNIVLKEIKTYIKNNLQDIHEYYHTPLIQKAFHYITRDYLKNTNIFVRFFVKFLFFFNKDVQIELTKMKKLLNSCQVVAKKLTNNADFITISIRINSYHPNNPTGVFIALRLQSNFLIHIYEKKELVLDYDDKVMAQLVANNIKEIELINEFRESCDFDYFKNRHFHLIYMYK
jgi:hypothetical protein